MARTYDRDLCTLLGDGSWPKEISKMIYVLAYRYLRNTADAEDLTQSVLTSLWEKCAALSARYDPEKGSWEGYILTVARNETSAELRGRGRFPQLDEEQVNLLEKIPDQAETPYQQIESKEGYTLILKCLSILEKDEQQLILMRDSEDRDWTEVYGVFDCEEHKRKVLDCPKYPGKEDSKCRMKLRVRHKRAIAKLKGFIEATPSAGPV